MNNGLSPFQAKFTNQPRRQPNQLPLTRETGFQEPVVVSIHPAGVQQDKTGVQQDKTGALKLAGLKSFQIR